MTSFKEDYEKKKKLKSKQLDDKIQKSTTWCKYPLFNPNSNVISNDLFSDPYLTSLAL